MWNIFSSIFLISYISPNMAQPGTGCDFSLWYNAIQQRNYQPENGCGLYNGDICPKQCDLSSVDDVFGGNALHFAASNGEPDEVEDLITRGNLPVNRKDNFGHRPLHFSAYADREDNARVLIKWGADPLIKARNGQGGARNKTPLEFCRTKKQSWCEALNIDGLERVYKSSPGNGDINNKDVACISADNCPSYTQSQLQQLMTIVGENEQTDFCQFYNVTCQNTECGIGMTWNSFTCIPDFKKYPPTIQFPSCPSSCSLSCPCGCQLTKDGVVGTQPFRLSALVGASFIQTVLNPSVLSACSPLQPCKVRGRCCRPGLNRQGRLRCPSRC